MSLAFTLFFFPTKTIYNLFAKRWKEYYQSDEVRVPSAKNMGIVSLGIYLIIQIALPIRHYFIPDNVLWTEEGHRLSWRMMLRTKTGTVGFSVVDKNTNKRTVIRLKDYLSPKQQRTIKSKPDVIWQFAQILKKDFALKGQDVAVYVVCSVKVNGRKYQRLVDPEVDLGSVSWNYFGHTDWVLDSGDYLEK